jgi:putative flavoprotein involved in K+ transport
MTAVVEEHTDLTVATRWLESFADALRSANPSAISALFRGDSHWRDMVIFSGRIRTLSGGTTIADSLSLACAELKPDGFSIDSQRSAPARTNRAGYTVIEVFFRFETQTARARGIVRIDPESVGDETPRAWTLFTEADEFKGHEESVGGRRPRGEVYSRDFSGPNWLDRRVSSGQYEDRDPTVLVVGGGQAGLSIAARLRQLDVDTLVIDRLGRIGDNWRLRYHALTLHNQVYSNHLPYMPFPPNFPTYLPKDKLASWFEAYVDAMEINYWTRTEFLGAERDEANDCWIARIRRDGVERTMRPRHIVMATGASDTPQMPHIEGLADFRGRAVHSSRYEDPRPWKGRHAVVIGTGTSGHDIAQDLYSNGVSVTMVQRSPTLIVSVEPSGQLPYTLYQEGRSLDECDQIAASMPLAWFEKLHRMLAVQAREMDKDLINALERVGFRINEEDETGWQFMYLNRGGGYYFNVGCSNLIAEGKIPLRQYDDFERLVPEGMQFRDGVVPADLIVFATGYLGPEHVVAQLFGSEVAARVGRVWGIDPKTQELNSVYNRTGQRGLWFIAGSFAQCRILSKYLALQVKAAEARLDVNE